MEGFTVQYTLQNLLSDSGSILTAVLGYMDETLGFFTTNSALMWAFIAGVGLLAFKFICKLFK